ncbi:copper-binding protein [Piscinibacter koreensis]|nr:copper-binding protein [Schlegelella koreensis]
MKATHSLVLLATIAFSVTGGSYAQSAGMSMTGDGMSMKAADKPSNDSQAATHRTDAVVKAADPSKGNVTLAHEPIKSLNWPAMTMSFAVKDKALFKKLAVGNKVHVAIKKQGADYVVTEVK